MYIRVTYDDKFDDLWMHLRAKYPDKLFTLDGVGSQLDMSLFSKKFFASNVTADVSIDANANVDDVTVIAYNTELPKPFFRMNSYYVLWKQLRKLYGLQVANEIVEMQLTGDIYIHDFHGVASGIAYCFNYSTYDVMTKGLPMIKKIKSHPPKHLYAFKSQLEQFTVIASNSTLGATGLADIFVVMSYYVKKIMETGRDAHFELVGLDLASRLTSEQREMYFKGNEELEIKVYNTLTDEQKAVLSEVGFDSEEFFDSLTEEQVDAYEDMRRGLMKKLIATFTEEQSFVYERNIYRYVKENLVSFIYTINQPMRANQSPFTNVSIYDHNFLEKMRKDYLFPDGSYPDINIVERLQNIYLDVMNKEMERTTITFPVTSACFSTDEENNIRDKDFRANIARKNLKYGFMSLYYGDESTLSSCCRLRSDRKSEYFNSFGSGSTKIGSQGVCAIGFPRLAIRSKRDREVFCNELRRFVGVCARVNHAKRQIIQKRIDNGNLPLYTYGFADLSHQYSTVGVNGLNECVEIMGYNILEKEGQDFVLEIMRIINEENDKYQEMYKAPHNCEQVPGENMSIKTAEKDKLLKYQDKYNIYSNQFIPLTTPADMLDRIKLQGMFDKHFSGGAICHINVEQRIEDPKILEDLIDATAKTGIVYCAINYNLQECEEGHITVGRGDRCSICGMPILNNYTRVVGFLTNTKNWHEVRRREDYPFRQWY